MKRARERQVGRLLVELAIGVEQRRDGVDVGGTRLADRVSHAGPPAQQRALLPEPLEQLDLAGVIGSCAATPRTSSP